MPIVCVVGGGARGKEESGQVAWMGAESCEDPECTQRVSEF